MHEFCDTMMSEFMKMLEHRSTRTVERPTFYVESVTKYKMKAKKVKLSSFDGDDHVGWVTCVETYFEVHGTLKEMEVRLANLSMEGEKIHWSICYGIQNMIWWLKQK